MSGEILCDECLDTGWNEDREGRYVCGCISETEPYQLLELECARLRAEVEALQKCCSQRGARMQIMRDWLDSPRGLHVPGVWPPTEWYYFCCDRPAAKRWFDENNVPV